MKKETTKISTKFSRRDLLTKAIPACAIVCIAPCKALSLTNSSKELVLQEGKHKFDTEMESKLTYRQLFYLQYSDIITFSKYLKQELGDKDALELIKKISDKRSINTGVLQAQQIGDNSLQAFVQQFKNPLTYNYSLTKEIIEDTDNSFEVKVTECLWADVFRSQDAADIGFAWICFGDYSWPKGFNPNLKMVRDKTLMEGDDYCNHRYVYET